MRQKNADQFTRVGQKNPKALWAFPRHNPILAKECVLILFLIPPPERKLTGFACNTSVE